MVTSTLLVVSYTVNLVEFAVLALFGRTFSLWLLFTALPALTGAVIIAKEQDLADGGQIFGIPTYMFVAALISIVLAYARTYHRSKSYR